MSLDWSLGQEVQGTAYWTAGPGRAMRADGAEVVGRVTGWDADGVQVRDDDGHDWLLVHSTVRAA